MKRLITVFLSLMFAVAPMCVYAAPATVSPSAVSTADNLVVITNPPYFTSTTQKGVVFCGYGKPGTKITFYAYSNGTYSPITSNGSPVTVTINASGVFWKKVNFTTGSHKVIVYAESNGAYQIVKREINVIGNGITDKLRDFTVNITNDLLVKGR